MRRLGPRRPLRLRAFNTKPVGQRIAIVAAGPIFNLILAVFLYAGLNMAGTEEPVAIHGAPPAAETPPPRAGLLAGDRILAIDGAGSRVRGPTPAGG